MGEGSFEATEGAGQRDLHRVTVTEASRILGVTESAVRKRVQRGTIPHEKAEDGRVYVYLDPTQSRGLSGKVRYSHASQSRSQSPGQSRDKYIRELEERNAFLEEQVKRQLEIIEDLVQRLPELEAPQEPREDHASDSEPVGEDRDRGTGSEAQEDVQAGRRSWWRRWLFGG